MNRQEVFNRVVAHLCQMPRRSMAFDNSCRLHGPEGLKCAVGCLISDDLYRPDLEGLWIEDAHEPSSPLHDALRRSGVPVDSEDDALLLDLLRDVHDTPTHWGPGGLNETGRVELCAIANAWRLDQPPELDSITDEALVRRLVGYWVPEIEVPR